MRRALEAPRWRAAALAVGVELASAALPAHALLEDDEARKAIVDLRGRVAALDEASRARSAEINAQLLEQIAVLRRSVLELNNQLEAMRGEVARLRGSNEQITRDLSDLQKRQLDASQSLDDRLRKMEPVKVTIDGRETKVDPAEKAAFDAAVARIRSGDFEGAVVSFSLFQRRYPASPYIDQARYWHANALYGRRDYKQAIDAYRAFVTGAPEHPNAPDALLAIANCQAEMKDPRGARRTLEELMKTYPQSEAAEAGKTRLAALPNR
jgi:tol-pal system protein YbgF